MKKRIKENTHRMRPARLRRSAGQRIVRRADHARTGEFRHQQISPVRIPAFHRGAGHRQTGCRHRQPRDGASLRRTFRSHIAGLPRNHGGQVPRVFPVDMIQGGAGTTTNMNANEVIANRALEIMGHARGEYQYCSPNDHVNCSQSTNDAYPSAIHLGLYATHLELRRHLEALIAAFARKGRRVRPRAQDGAHAVAGRRTHDPRADVPRFCERPAGRGRQPRPRGTGVPVDQHGRHGHRHGHLRRAGLCRALYGGHPGDHRLGRDAGRRPRRGRRPTRSAWSATPRR